MTKQPSVPVIAHPTSSAELRQARAELFARDRALLEEGAASFAAMKAGSPPSKPLTDHARRVTAHVQLLMNGATPAQLLMPQVTRDQQIAAERDAIAYVSRCLDRQLDESIQRDAEEYVARHADAWRALCAEIVLCAVRLASLEDKARAFLEPLHPGLVALPMGSTIGSGLSLLGIGDSLLEMRTSALAEGIVTSNQIRKAFENVK